MFGVCLVGLVLQDGCCRRDWLLHVFPGGVSFAELLFAMCRGCYLLN